MRKTVTLLLLSLCSVAVFSQKPIAAKVALLNQSGAYFKTYSLLTAVNATDTDIDKIVAGATLADLNTESLSALVANKDAHIEVAIPYGNSTITVQLYKINPFAEGFHVDTDKAKGIAYEPGVYYRGIIKGDANSIAAFNFFDNEFNGLLSSEALGNVVTGKLQKPGNVTGYIVYQDRNMKVTNDFKCATEDAPRLPVAAVPLSSNTGEQCVKLYFELNHDLYVAHGNSAVAATNWLTGVFNNVQALYANDGITVMLQSLFIWTSPDPYNGTTSGQNLNLFTQYRPDFNGDLGQLLTLGKGYGGIAPLNQLCADWTNSYADVDIAYQMVPAFSWTVEVISHEFGHTMGSPHTQACSWNNNSTPIDGCVAAEGNCGPAPVPFNGGTVMSYCHVTPWGINFAYGFGPQPAQLLQLSVNSRECLERNCFNCDYSISDITTTSDAPGTFTVSWNQLAGTAGVEVSVTPSGAAAVWTPVSGSPYTVSGLQADLLYVVRVRADRICANDVTPVILSTSVQFASQDYCSGAVITDSGTATGNYYNNENYVRTLIPALAEKKIRLAFTQFDLEQGYDYLYVYNGNSTNAPEISNGGFSGTALPAPFTSTAADGSLTLRFVSDSFVTGAGFAASVSCEELLSTAGFESMIDFTYAPNPTNGKVSIRSKTKMDKISVHTLTGQLVTESTKGGTVDVVDLSSFAAGTYMVTVTFGTRQVDFKVVKK